MKEIWERNASDDEIVNCSSSYENCDVCVNKEVCFTLMTEMAIAGKAQESDNDISSHTTKKTNK